FFENFDYKSLENLLIVILLREDLRPEQKFDELKAIYEISKLQGEYKYFVLSDVSQGHLLPTIAHRKAIVAYLISKHVRPS
ncbi:MAG: hypothetical protein LBF15_06830, partial [Candidatus Peribacteria bacterium]|nr:hypothetical protein [Candidatus Peribacteria bacterium]